MTRGLKIAVWASMLLAAGNASGQTPEHSVVTDSTSVDCIAAEIVSFAWSATENDKGPQGLSARPLWEMPTTATAWSLAAIAGTSHFYLEASQRVNKLVREETQLWRRRHTDNQTVTFDNLLLYMPLAATAGLKLAGLESDYNLLQTTLISAEAFVVSSMMVFSLKHTVREWRPDRGSSTSFPSGHTATAFCGAELLRLEYGRQEAWVPVAGYAVATVTGLMRIYNDRHWTGDVVSGACIGVLAADLTYWINQKIAQRRQAKQHTAQNEQKALPYIL